LYYFEFEFDLSLIQFNIQARPRSGLL